ncbi:MAG TPA: hypothetical protein VF729_09730, partial [Solirubrobacterales bacterium]
DVYALGCLLFKLLTGEVPFPKEGEAARLYAHLNDPPPAPSLYVPEVPMALDDVVIRAMSKQPGDRYPSAGDLGRAAVAALSGERPALPERTVATGAAATKESVSPEPPTVAQPTQPPEPPTRRMAGEDAAGRRRWALAAIAGALVAAIAAVAIAFGGGGGSDPPASAGETPSASRGNVQRDEPASASKPKPLVRSELIARADSVCEESQRRYREVRDLESEYSADVPYAEALVRFARERIGGLKRLRPPPQLAEPYREYVEAQERVYATDKQALAAARRGDAAGIEEARNRRDSEDRLREGLAREIGFNVCSTSRG